MKNCVRFFGLGLLWLLALGGVFRAGAYGGPVRTERSVGQTAREDGREFTLRTQVWTENPAGLREPYEILTAEGTERLAARLEHLADAAERGGAPVCLVILAGDGAPPAGEDALAMLRSVQRVKELGGRAFVCGGEGWQVLASAPAEEHLFAPGREDDCAEAARRWAEGLYEAQVVERLDPRFTISLEERGRLEEAGAQVRAEGAGWVVTWTAELPRGRDEPWAGEVTVEAKAAFPGGNGVTVCGEDAGVFLEGKRVAGFPQVRANVGVKLDVRDAGAKIFLGETVPVTVGGGCVEDVMTGGGPQWFGKSAAGTFSFQWEGVGALEGLGKIKPQESTEYRLRVAFTPLGSGSGAAGAPVGRTTAEGCYRVTVMPGVLRVQVAGEGLDRNSTLALRVEGKDVARTVVARPEADPQGGGIMLAAVLDDLPYGKYTVTPGVMMDGRRLPAQECLLGVCREDDTVDIARRFGVVKLEAGESAG